MEAWKARVGQVFERYLTHRALEREAKRKERVEKRSRVSK